MPVTAPISRMRSFARGVADMADGAILRRESGMLEESRVALREAVTECFLLQRDPDGKPWANRKTVYGDYRDTNPILFDLLSSLRFEVVYQSTGAFLRRAGSGVSVISDKGYAFFHQTGTRFMVARKFIPSVSRPGQLRDRLLLAGLRGLRRVLGR